MLLTHVPILYPTTEIIEMVDDLYPTIEMEIKAVAVENNTAQTVSEHDCFKEKFKHYKRSKDLSGVLDLTVGEDLSNYNVEEQPLRGCSTSSAQKASSFGLRAPSEWRLHSLPSHPGLFLIPNPFQSNGQHAWVKRCLVNYPRKPNICNLDAHIDRKGSGSVWPPEWPDETKALTSPAKKLRMSDSTVSLQAIPKDSLLYRLRWVTLGYHYDWTTKEYSENRRSQFPEDLAQLSAFIVGQAGFPRFIAEAAIVNYYHLDSTLSGHTDHSEKDLSHPLLSISFGQSAIFLIGGKSKCVEPVPILLRSGDVVIMSGESRLAYHGVPKIISPKTEAVPISLSTEMLSSADDRPCPVVTKESSDEQPSPEKAPEIIEKEIKKEGPTTQCCHCDETELTATWTDFMSYLCVSRINVNVRQVNPT